VSVDRVVGRGCRFPVGRHTAPAGGDRPATGNRAPVDIRRTVRRSGSVVVVGILLSACGSSSTAATQQAATPRTVCSLVSNKQVGVAIGTPVHGPNSCTVAPGNQSSALYLMQGGTGGAHLQVSLFWGSQAVTTFTVSHSGHARYVTQQGSPGAPPEFAKVNVSGVPAYWQVSPAPQTGDPGAMRISALKGGYVVSIASSGLNSLQDQRVLATILGNI